MVYDVLKNYGIDLEDFSRKIMEDGGLYLRRSRVENLGGDDV